MNIRSILPSLVLSIVLTFLVFLSFQQAKSRPGTVVLPGGVTYFGPSPTPVAWSEMKGKIYPYSFSYPSALSLGVFPNDPYDGVTIFIAGTDPQANLFFRVEPCKGPPCRIEYAQNWWKQYSWKGVDSVSTFTNSKGLKGYRAKYKDDTGKTPYDHVFFEVPGRADLIVWISGKLFAPDIFNKLVDSVMWK